MNDLFNVETNIDPSAEEMAMHALQVWLHGKKMIGAEKVGRPRKVSFVVKRNDGQIIGGLMAKLQMKILFIESAWVNPDFQKMGAGKAMQEKVYHFAKENDCEYLLATSYEFYDAVGYLMKNDPEAEVFAKIENCPAPYTMFYLRKKL